MGFCLGYKMKRFLVALGLFCCTQSLQAQALKTLLPDLTWGTGGVVQTGRETSPAQHPQYAFLQPDEKLVVGLYGNPAVSWARFHPDGREDLSFRQSTLWQTLMALNKPANNERFNRREFFWDAQGRLLFSDIMGETQVISRISAQGLLEGDYRVAVPAGGYARRPALRSLKDGGLISVSSGVEGIIVRRFLSNSQIDERNFAKGESFYGPPISQATPLLMTSFVLDEDGSLVILWASATAPKPGQGEVSYLLSRLRDDGLPDTSFGRAGILSFADKGHNALHATSIRKTADATYVFTGNRFDEPTIYSAWRIKNNSPDVSFWPSDALGLKHITDYCDNVLLGSSSPRINWQFLHFNTFFFGKLSLCEPGKLEKDLSLPQPGGFNKARVSSYFQDVVRGAQHVYAIGTEDILPNCDSYLACEPTRLYIAKFFTNGQVDTSFATQGALHWQTTDTAIDLSAMVWIEPLADGSYLALGSSRISDIKQDRSGAFYGFDATGKAGNALLREGYCSFTKQAVNEQSSHANLVMGSDTLVAHNGYQSLLNSNGLQYRLLPLSSLNDTNSPVNTRHICAQSAPSELAYALTLAPRRDGSSWRHTIGADGTGQVERLNNSGQVMNQGIGSKAFLSLPRVSDAEYEVQTLTSISSLNQNELLIAQYQLSTGKVILSHLDSLGYPIKQTAVAAPPPPYPYQAITVSSVQLLAAKNSLLGGAWLLVQYQPDTDVFADDNRRTRQIHIYLDAQGIERHRFILQQQTILEVNSSDQLYLREYGALTTFSPSGQVNRYALENIWNQSIGWSLDNKLLLSKLGKLYRYTHPDFTANAKPSQRYAVEFYNNQLRHFFITADAAEQSAILAGTAGAGWSLTGQRIAVSAEPRVDLNGESLPVYRFYGTPGVGPNSHFYTQSAQEAETVKKDPGWRYEGIAFYAPEPAKGKHCYPPSQAVTRYYNKRWAERDSNHRFLLGEAASAEMLAAGWAKEGEVFCSVN
jgi:Repeat of unknown function (DUF5648)